MAGGSALTPTSVGSKSLPLRNHEAAERGNNNSSSNNKTESVSSIEREMVKRPRGRPAGSKNKLKTHNYCDSRQSKLPQSTVSFKSAPV
ncbi:unnamed protein product [Microthlaspi erraticum]|uniref:Uncharacterized protein n=1 Tax=Microthlaspi erraticum TaxID=1685480 RepID=A0A6D2JKX7_9BRAS|nr:unnamed protein product [Microthlaspi erraticum]CAA7055853.1 unnamed protein product [Microthlaspi erraticum]